MATQLGNIPVKNIKENKLTFTKILSEMLKFYIDNDAFPNNVFALTFKKGDIQPAYKKDDLFDKTNHSHISILPILPKAFERCL